MGPEEEDNDDDEIVMIMGKKSKYKSNASNKVDMLVD